MLDSESIDKSVRKWFKEFLDHNQKELYDLINYARSLTIVVNVFCNSENLIKYKADVIANPIYHALIQKITILAYEIMFGDQYTYAVNKLFTQDVERKKKITSSVVKYAKFCLRVPDHLEKIFPHCSIISLDKPNPYILMINNSVSKYDDNSGIWFDTLNKWRNNCAAHMGPRVAKKTKGSLLTVIDEVINFLKNLLNGISLSLTKEEIGFQSEHHDQKVEANFLKFLKALVS